ncbi:BTAD domain-containing putative transcriptional regulator [Curtobacterium aetherium]|uniref:Winged helix-turn-helix domain-containing protein n=1 Tax=Curtobacterium aetherium TaxID=2841594 RepID=A0ACD1E7S4_9MICO|nr:BTAD domain-containing putative transcriptional regulator [Curtobacterium sp. L6-1]QWS34956.1 winged helix-turn-helix domain-containing protein [Curtobacterium sp. L6-1]
MDTPAIPTLRFTVLGPVTAVSEDTELDVGSPQQRAVLAMLLLADGHPVDVDTVVDRIWGSTPPRSAAGVLRTYVYRLRRVLAPVAEATGLRIGSDGGAYRLVRGRSDLDLAAVEAARRRAHDLDRAGDPSGAVEHLAAAEDRWNGNALGGLHGPWADAERSRLGELHDEVALERAALEFRLGRAADALPGLRRVAAARPLDERVAVLLLESLLDTGLRTEALATYDRFRRQLADQLGVSPGAALQRTHQQLLRDDVPGHPTGREAPPASGTEPPVRTSAPPAGAATPAQLPPDLPEFVGRGDELARVEEAVATGATGVVIGFTGLGGMGKTALAVHAAHRVRAAFPGGQFAVDLRAAGGHPLTAAEALLSLLQSAGVPRAAIPDGLDDRCAAWRSVVADRRVLLVLDDAASAAQVRPLVPTGPGSLTLVTSVRRFVDLAGIRWSTLLPLAPHESFELMGRLVGHDRLAAEPGPTARLASACSHQPLAVRVAAARLADRPSWSVAQIEQQLYDDLDQPVVMHADCRIVDAPFRRASASLLEEQRDAFHRLAHLPDRPFTTEEAAWALRRDVGSTRALLEDLVDAHLLVDEGGQRYGFFALVRAFARRQPVRARAA